jgi:hypothetical protein
MTLSSDSFSRYKTLKIKVKNITDNNSAKDAFEQLFSITNQVKGTEQRGGYRKSLSKIRRRKLKIVENNMNNNIIIK